MREETKVSFKTLNGEKLRGTITPQEARHGIYKD
jgi:hypothetical protein